MTITEFAILPFKSPTDLSDPTLRSHFEKLSEWQSDCSGFPLRFFVNSVSASDACQEVYLVTGWTSVMTHEAWIRGTRNQELLKVFAPYAEIEQVRVVHVDVNFEAAPGPKGTERMMIERWGPAGSDASESAGWAWTLTGRDLGQEGGDVYRFAGVCEDESAGGLGTPVERWFMEKVELGRCM